MKTKKESRALAGKEHVRALKELKGFNHTLYMIMRVTGIRIGEVEQYVNEVVRVAGIDGIESVVIKPQKGNESRRIPIVKHASTLIDISLNTKALEKRIQRGRLGFSAHDLRATFATTLYNKGVDLVTIQKLGGWKKLSSVARYIRIAIQDKQGLYELVTQAPWDLSPAQDRITAENVIKKLRIENEELKNKLRKAGQYDS